MQDIHKLCWSMIAISKYHPQWVSSCMFCLKISVSWKMGVTSGQCAEILHYIMYWFSLPQRDLYMGCPTAYSASCKEKENWCQWHGNVWWEMFPPACIDNRPVTPKSWGWSAPPCITVGLSQTWKKRLKHSLAFSPSLCRAVWPDLLPVSLPDNSSSFEAAMISSWPCQTLFHHGFCPSYYCSLCEDWRIWMHSCCSKVFSSRSSTG